MGKLELNGLENPDNRKGMEPSLLRVYRWALSFFAPYKWSLIAVVALGSVAAGIELTVPMFFQSFIDVMVSDKRMDLFGFWLIALAIALGIMIGANVVKNTQLTSMQERAARDVQLAMITKLRDLGFSYYEKHPVGETLALMNTEMKALQSLYRDLFPRFIQDALFTIIAFGFMATISWQLTLWVLPFFLSYYLIGPFIVKKLAYYGKETSDARVQLNQHIYETASALPELRTNRAFSWAVTHIIDSIRHHNARFLRWILYMFLRNSARSFSYHLGGLAVFVFGFRQLQNGSMSIGELTAFILYYFLTINMLTSVISLATEQQALMHQARKLYQLAHLTPDVSEPAQCEQIGEVKGGIQFENVTFSYRSKQPLLRNVNLMITPGQTVAIVGTSGGGKSTLLKLICRFYDPVRGRILLDGIPVSRLSFEELRGVIGYVFQETYLFGTSVKDNIRFGRPDASEDEIIAAAKAAGAHEFIKELPQGYDTLLGERGTRLSGGEKQRISIARMFVKDPKIILLDEATSSLDHVNEAKVYSALKRLFQGRTTVIVAHRLSTIREADNIIVVERGQVVETGTYEQLMKRIGALYTLEKG